MSNKSYEQTRYKLRLVYDTVEANANRLETTTFNTSRVLQLKKRQDNILYLFKQSYALDTGWELTDGGVYFCMLEFDVLPLKWIPFITHAPLLQGPNLANLRVIASHSIQVYPTVRDDYKSVSYVAGVQVLDPVDNDKDVQVQVRILVSLTNPESFR